MRLSPPLHCIAKQLTRHKLTCTTGCLVRYQPDGSPHRTSRSPRRHSTPALSTTAASYRPPRWRSSPCWCSCTCCQPSWPGPHSRCCREREHTHRKHNPPDPSNHEHRTRRGVQQSETATRSDTPSKERVDKRKAWQGRVSPRHQKAARATPTEEIVL